MFFVHGCLFISKVFLFQRCFLFQSPRGRCFSFPCWGSNVSGHGLGPQKCFCNTKTKKNKDTRTSWSKVKFYLLSWLLLTTADLYISDSKRHVKGYNINMHYVQESWKRDVTCSYWGVHGRKACICYLTKPTRNNLPRPCGYKAVHRVVQPLPCIATAHRQPIRDVSSDSKRRSKRASGAKLVRRESLLQARD